MFAYLFAGNCALALHALLHPLRHTLRSRRAPHPPRHMGPAGARPPPTRPLLPSIYNAFSLQVVPPVHQTLQQTHAVIHFHVQLSINTPGGQVNWFKQYEDAGSKDIWPISPTNQVTDLFATKMHEARVALPPTGHDWKGIGARKRSPRLHFAALTPRDRLFRARAIKLTSFVLRQMEKNEANTLLRQNCDALASASVDVDLEASLQLMLTLEGTETK
jgi:hypothetical protein